MSKYEICDDPLTLIGEISYNIPRQPLYQPEKLDQFIDYITDMSQDYNDEVMRLSHSSEVESITSEFEEPDISPILNITPSPAITIPKRQIGEDVITFLRSDAPSISPVSASSPMKSSTETFGSPTTRYEDYIIESLSSLSDEELERRIIALHNDDVEYDELLNEFENEAVFIPFTRTDDEKIITKTLVKLELISPRLSGLSTFVGSSKILGMCMRLVKLRYGELFKPLSSEYYFLLIALYILLYPTGINAAFLIPSTFTTVCTLVKYSPSIYRYARYVMM